MPRDYHKTIHELKTWPNYYQDVREGRKSFELRKDDRPFAVDDLIILREYDPDAATYTGYVTCAIITCIVRGAWLAPGYVALGIRVLE